MTTATLAALLIISGPPGASGAAPGSVALLPRCVVSLVNQVQLSAESPGVLMTIDVKEGDRIDKGSILARVDDLDVRVRHQAALLELKVADAQASNDINVRAAAAAAKVAAQEVKESKEINSRTPGTIPYTQVRREELTQERAELQVGVAQMEQEVARLTKDVRQAQVDAAQNEIIRRRIDAPINGEVVQIYRQPGEWVQPGDPVMRLVRMDKLRIEGFLRADQFAPGEVDGQPVVVDVKLERGRVERFTGQIKFVSPLVEASGDFRVWAEVDNRMDAEKWVLRPGLSASMTITLKPR